MVIREGMLCLLIKKGEEELESSKYGTFVEVLDIGEIRPERPPIFVKDVDGSDFTRCNVDDLIPLAEHCKGERIQDILQRENHRIVKNFVMMIHDLQRQNEALLSQIGSVNEGLKKTQGDLREHSLKPH